MKNLIIGFGEIGQAVFGVISQGADDIKILDRGELPEQYARRAVRKGYTPNVMHICFPYTRHFSEAVRNYIGIYKPEHIIVWSTVAIGTCEEIDPRIVHSPVEGIHPHLQKSIQISKRWLGANLGAEAQFFCNYFAALGISSSLAANSRTTELLKLRSTSKYGVNILWAQYEQDLCKEFGVEYTSIMQFDQEYNQLYEALGKGANVKRYVLFPPDGKIGGHCIVPNAEILNAQKPNEMLDKMISMGQPKKPEEES